MEQTVTQRDGSFQLSGFKPGRYRLTADAYPRSSKRHEVELRHDEVTEVEIVVEPQ